MSWLFVEVFKNSKQEYSKSQRASVFADMQVDSVYTENLSWHIKRNRDTFETELDRYKRGNPGQYGLQKHM